MDGFLKEGLSDCSKLVVSRSLTLLSVTSDVRADRINQDGSINDGNCSIFS
jgi:hypothetical protein